MSNHPRWVPAPIDLIRASERTRWSSENPAPELVGYLVIRRSLVDDPSDATSERTWAQFLGWSRYQARSTIRRVGADLEAWKVRPTLSTNVGHYSRITSDGCDDVSTNLDQFSTTRARDPLIVTTTTTGHKKRGGSLSVSETWNQVEQLRLEALPGALPVEQTRIFLRGLQARIRESGSASVVLVWRWLLNSQQKDAGWLRSNGYGSKPATIHGRKFGDYLGRAREWSHVTEAEPAAPAEDALVYFLNEGR
jgi:hypothetical protein